VCRLLPRMGTDSANSRQERHPCPGSALAEAFFWARAERMVWFR